MLSFGVPDQRMALLHLYYVPPDIVKYLTKWYIKGEVVALFDGVLYSLPVREPSWE